jgi:hypothetical protein
MNDISLSRLCADCKSEIIIRKKNIDEVILYEGSYYHKECFINMCNKKLQSKRCKKNKWEKALSNLDMFCNDAKVKLNKEFDRDEKKEFECIERKKRNIEIEKKRKEASKKNSVEQIKAKDDIYNFMLNNYEVSFIPKYVFIKLSSIYSGTYKGMSCGILPTELLDMWKRKINYLNKIANNNLTKGNNMNPIQRINYDLSILINKYDSYKKWKESQKILEYETSLKINNSNKILNTSIINEISQHNISNDKEAEISDLVDDIFD